MRKKSLVFAFVIVLLIVAAVPAFAAGPNFGEAIYADGVAWGTKGTTDLPAPNEHNRQSFDGLFKIGNGVDGQLAVAEAAPGNTDYNGGRWIEYTLSWVDGAEKELVTSYDQLHDLIYVEGKLTMPVETQKYFQCPLLPVK
jgi:hypothetical protein